jgi:tetratricopeptide (TPR) repeat protein
MLIGMRGTQVAYECIEEVKKNEKIFLENTFPQAYSTKNATFDLLQIIVYADLPYSYDHLTPLRDKLEQLLRNPLAEKVSFRIRMNLGCIYFKMGLYKPALEVFQELMEDKINNRSLSIRMLVYGTATVCAGEVEGEDLAAEYCKILNDLKKYICGAGVITDLSIKLIEANLILFEALRKKNTISPDKFDEAIEAKNDVFKTPLETANSYHLLSLIYCKNGNWKEARNNINKALKKNNESNRKKLHY